MPGKRNPQVSNRIASLASFFVAFISLYAGIYHYQVVSSLLEKGKRTYGIVKKIESGARNSKWAVYRFETEAGETVTARDSFQMFINRPRKGQQVTVIYDPSDPDRVTADLGIWIWQGPVIFFVGFFLLGSLGIAIWIYKQ